MKLSELRKMLKRNGFSLIRRKSHEVWQRGKDRVILTTSKPSYRHIKATKARVRRLAARQ